MDGRIIAACKNGIKDRYYEYEPSTLTENDESTIVWDMAIQIDK